MTGPLKPKIVKNRGFFFLCGMILAVYLLIVHAMNEVFYPVAFHIFLLKESVFFLFFFGGGEGVKKDMS